MLATVAVGREQRPFDAGWRFYLGDAAGAEAPTFDAGSWQIVDLPHDWSIALPIDRTAPAGGAGGFFPTGIGWYRKSFAAPESWRGQRVGVEFDGVYRNAEVWINGQRLGAHPYGYTPFRYDLTPYVKLGAANVLAVRVDNSSQPNSRWYAGSGIYRHVWLVTIAPVHVAADSVYVRTTTLADARAVIRVEGTVRNEAGGSRRLAVEIGIVDPAGHTVGQARRTGSATPGPTFDFSVLIDIPDPEAWSPDRPVLYRAVVRVLAGERELDRVTVRFGIRTIRVSAESGLQLNGRTIKLVGANVHADNGPLGAAAFDRAEERRVELMKAAGFNAIRTAHNPPSPAFLEACDRLGMLVLDEAFDGWEKGKNPHDYSVDFKTWWRRDVDAMVRRDRNHPSIVLWSIGNEMNERMNANGLRIARELTGRIRELDQTRPITAGVNGPGKNGEWAQADPLFATLEVAGYNYELARHTGDHERVANRVILVTESYQHETFANWSVAHDTPYVIGDFVWSGMDYLGEAGIGRVFPPGEPIVKHWEGNQYPWHGAACGDIDITGWRKPISHYRAIVWDRGEKLYLSVLVPPPARGGTPANQDRGVGTPRPPGAGSADWGVSPWAVPPALPSWTWPGQEGKNLSVEVDSRYDAVRLYLNDRLIAEKPTTRAEQFKAMFAVPYAPGELRAVGVQDGHEREALVLQTAGPAARIRLSPDRTVVRADGQDLCFVTVEVTDAAGRLVPASGASLQFSVDGPGTIAAIGNADLTSFETCHANPHRVFRGRALLVVRTTPTAGRITLSATAPGLAATSAALEAK